MSLQFHRCGPIATLLFAAACASSEPVTPTITAIRGKNLAISPLPVCTGPGTPAPGSFAGFTVTPVTVLGADFLPNVDLTSDDPAPSTPVVTLVNAGGEKFTVFTHYASPEELDAQIPDTDDSGHQAIPYGPFDLVVETPDRTSAVAPHAIDHVPPPQVTAVQPPSICRDRTETVVVSGTGFAAGAPTVTSNVSGSFTAAANPTSLTVTIPAGTFPSAPFPFTPGLVIQDLAGCQVPVALTVNSGCGP